MTILGLDPSLASFGWAILDDNEYLESCGVIKTDSTQLLINRFSYIREKIGELLSNPLYDISCVGIESVAGYSAINSPMMYAIYVLSMLSLRDSKKLVIEIAPLQLKSLIGVKTSKKSEIVKRAKEILGIRLKSDIADAYFIGAYAGRFGAYLKGKKDIDSFSQVERKIFFSEELNSKGIKRGIVYRENELYHDFREAPVA